MRKNPISKSQLNNEEIDLKPFMNLMVVLIPLLLVTSEFSKIAIVDLKPAANRGSGTNIDSTRQNVTTHKLLLTAIVTDSTLTLGAKGNFLNSFYYREFNEHIISDYYPDREPAQKQKANIHQSKTVGNVVVNKRDETILLVTDETGTVLQRLYTGCGRLLVGKEVIPLQTVLQGDMVYTLCNPVLMHAVKDPSQFVLKPLSVYDELKRTLIKVKDRYRDADDSDELTLAVENSVNFDKIVQIIDAARAADYPDISISRLRI